MNGKPEVPFGGKGILIPFARKPAVSSKPISPSQKRAEMSPEAAPKGIADQLMKAVAQYEERFDNPFPSASLQSMSMEDQLDLINEALASGKPPSGWEKLPMGDVNIVETTGAPPQRRSVQG